VRVRRFGAFEGVRADQLGETVGIMSRSFFDGAHLVDYDVMAALSELPRCFRSREATAYNPNHDVS
jgi:hypothetical protein